MQTNRDIASRLLYFAQILEVSGMNADHLTQCRKAAKCLRNLETDLHPNTDIHAIPELSELSSFILEAIVSQLQTGSIPDLVEQENKIPKGVLRMLNITGLGPKKVAILWREMGILNLHDLAYACVENRLTAVKGFGLVTQEKLARTLKEIRLNEKEFLYSDLLEYQLRLESLLSAKLLGNPRLQVTGAMRRHCSLVHNIQFLAEPDTYKDIMLLLVRTEGYELLSAGSDMLLARIKGSQIPVEFQFRGIDFYRELFLSTGPEAHTDLIPLEDDHIYRSETEIYEKARLPYIAPYLREGQGEIRKAYRNLLPDLVTAKDLKGLLHLHTKQSDGLHCLKEMALAGRDLGMDWIGVTDHVQTGRRPNGISPPKLGEQFTEIEMLNEELSPFKILKGIEVDILEDGQLNMSNLELSAFDFVLASVHEELYLGHPQETERLLKAIKNPYTNILGHFTGRKLLQDRQPVLDMERIIEACADYNVAIEINCQPLRIDPEWAWIRYAVDQGVMLCINPNAHRKEELKLYEWGLLEARKGMLNPSQTLNCYSYSEIQDWFLAKRKSRIS